MKKTVLNKKALLYLKRGVDFERRRIWLEGDVDDRSVGHIIRALQYMSAVDQKQPITLFINSFGGNISDGLALIDMMNFCGAQVNTVTMGSAFSMALIVFLAGKERYSLPSSRFMNHSASSSIEGKKESMKSTLKNIEEIEELCLKSFKNTKKSIAWWEAKTKSEDFFFSAKEALKLGVVTKIIGEDE